MIRIKDINNKNINTFSSKIKKASLLKKYVYEKILGNQEVLRYLKYNTLKPLDDVSRDFNNVEVKQPDVTRKEGKTYIRLLPFVPEMSVETRSFICINLVNGNFKSNNKLRIDVNIVCNGQFEDIIDGVRSLDVASRIGDIFDEIYIDEKEWTNDLGNLKFEVIDFGESRLSKTNDYVWVRVGLEVGITPLARIMR